jgi:hypothetical protein
MAVSPTKPGTKRLSESARHLVLPSGITSTGWPAVRAKALEVGLGADPWQDGAGRCILAKRADGLYAAGIGGVVISIPRQVGKTYLIGLIVFCLCLLNPNLTVIWTAHQLKTAGETFRSMQAMARRKKIAPSVLRVRLGSGDEAIEFRNGSRILFGARERGFGLGFTMVDVLVIDEVQRVTERTMDDLVPTTNQSPNPLILMMGTPPRPTDPGEVFRSRRQDALSGESDDLMYLEFSADLGVEDPDTWARNHIDWQLVEQANPSVPERTPRAAILRMRKNLGLASFLLEGLGVWDSSVSSSSIPETTWSALENKSSTAENWSVVLEVTRERDWACIVAAGLNPQGQMHVEITQNSETGEFDHRPGTAWVVERIVRVLNGNPLYIAAGSGAEPLVPDLQRAGVWVERIPAAKIAPACGRFYDLATSGQLAHPGQTDLTAAVLSARQKFIGDKTFIWMRPPGVSDISAMYGATLAAWVASGAW